MLIKARKVKSGGNSENPIEWKREKIGNLEIHKNTQKNKQKWGGFYLIYVD